jgi:uncharacterized protein (TIRG00374 family)
VPAPIVSRLIVFVALAITVFAALVIYADADELFDALDAFKWWLAAPIVGLVALNYLLRFVRWQYYLAIIGADQGLSLAMSALIFLSGLAMVITPAKAGEWIKSYFLYEANRTPVARSASVVFVERLTDAWSVFLLGLSGLILFRPSYWPFFLAFALVQLLFVVVVRNRQLSLRILAGAGKLPLVSRISHHFEEVYEAAYQLLYPRPLLAGLALGLLGWGCEAVGFYLVVYGLTGSSEVESLVKGAFIMSTATLAGALFVVPGGLGISEAGITALSRSLLDLSMSTAAAATVLIRFFTLWFGVGVGLIALLLLSRRLGEPDVSALETPETTSV